MATPSNTDAIVIREMLATITANVMGMRREMDLYRVDLSESKVDDRTSRAAMHDNVEELTTRIGTLETSVAVIGQMMAQDRDATHANTKAITAFAPTIDQWRRMVRTGYGVVGFLSVGGIGLGASIVWWGDQITEFVRWLFRIH